MILLEASDKSIKIFLKSILYKKRVYKKHETEIRQEVRNADRLSFKQ